jgi:PAS domain S-box-containing protein
MDITERKRAEGALRARELNLRLILDSIPAPVALMTPSGQVESVNHLVLEYFGKTFEELKRWGTSDAVHPDDLSHAIAVWQEAIETGQPYDVKERLRRFDGVYRWFGVRGFPLRDPDGRILNWCVLLTDIDDRERAEEALRQSEQRWRTAFENSAISIMMRNLEGRFIAANSVFQNMLGYTESELCQLNFMDVTHDEDCKGELQLVAEILEGKRQHYQIEKRYRRKDGTLFWVRNNVALVPGVRDSPPFLFAVVEDITQRRQEESARRYSEERYSVVVETANDAVVSADESGAIQFANPATTRVFGYDPAELIGKPLTVLMPEFMRKLHENGFRRYLATGQRHINWQGTELTGLRKNGQEFQLEVSFGELTTNGRRLFTGFIRDITERKQAEDTFRLIVAGTAATTGSDFFQSLVQHMAQALRARYAFVTTCDDQKHARSLAFWKGDGFGEDFEFDIPDTPCEKVLHGNVCHYRQGLQGLFPLDKLLADWQTESYLGVPMLDRSNRVIGHIAILDSKPMEVDLRAIDLLKIFASRAAAELNRQKAEVQLQAALQERERLRNAQAELAHINRVSTMGELTASLAHEIKQPMFAAAADAETCLMWLARPQPDVAEAQEAALRLMKDVTRASDIINRIGSLFKMDVPKRELVDINELIREMIGLMRSEASRYSISIRTELADGLPKIMADRVGLQQVLMNLMLNGVEAMRDMIALGTLTIVSRRSEDGQLTVSILDTGVGVSSEQVDKIFSAFVTSKAQGTGMGLPISRSIIESHGGRLWATPNTGPGATFQFVLPVEPSAHQTA